MRTLRLVFLLLATSLPHAQQHCTADHYAVLGIDRGADNAAIKKAYRQLSLKHHPDKQHSDDAEAAHKTFVAIANAHGVLVDPEARKRFDQYSKPRDAHTANDLYVDVPAISKFQHPNFPGKGGKDAWLVVFHVAWCPHCKSFVQTFADAAMKCHDVVKAGAVDCVSERKLCAEHGVHHYPTVKLIVDGKAIEYNGDRHEASMESFVLERVPRDHITQLFQPQDLWSFLNEECQHLYDLWTACAVIVTKGNKTSPSIEAVWSEWRGKIAIAEVPATNKALMKELGVASIPALKVICDGNLEVSERYTGPLDVESLNQYLSTFEDKHKCRMLSKEVNAKKAAKVERDKQRARESARKREKAERAERAERAKKERAEKKEQLLAKLKIQAPREFERMSSSELKSILRDLDEECVGCVDRIHFLQKVKQLSN